MTLHVHITGDSHSWILSSGVAGLGGARAVPPAIKFSFHPMGRGEQLLSRFYRMLDGDLQVIDRSDAEKFRSFPGVSGDVVCGICTNFAVARVLKKRVTAHFAPAALAREEIAVSEAVLHEVFRSAAEQVFIFVDMVRSRGIPVFFVEGPYFFPKGGVFESLRKEVAIDLGRQYRRYLRLELVRRGIPNIPTPDDFTGEDGMMLSAYASAKLGDHVHGNVKFGELMLSRVYERFADPHWIDALRRLSPSSTG